MLSRVSAVKAPRTHNRRRVTGSSGRRREGRESEPQRPNMSRRVITSAVLLLVVMMCCGTGGAKTEEVKLLSESKFKWKDVKDEEGGVTVESLGAPGLLNVGSDVFAVAEAQCKKKGESKSFTGIASQIITIDNANTPVEVLKDPKDTQFLEDGSADLKKKVDVSRPTTILKGNDIYMLAGKYSRTSVRGAQGSGEDDSGLLLVKGDVSEEIVSNKRIKWSDDNAVPRATVGELDSWTGLIGGGGSGVKMEDGTLVFPVEGTNQVDTEKDVKTVSLIIYSLDANSWKLSKGMSDGGCSDPSVVEWEGKLMMMTECDDGRRRVYESGDKGESWTEALGTLSRVWGNKQGNEKRVGSGFTTANIVVDGGAKRNVMLVTLPVYAEEGNKKGKLHLWLTDNTHIVYIGPVSEKDDDAAASSLLYKSAGSEDNNDELIALYEKKKDVEETSHSLWSVLLTEQLERVKKVLAAWKKADDRVSQLCATLLAQEERASTDTDCDAVKITDGLVGFLSDKFSDGIWRDEYLGVNATAKNGAAAATGTSDGVKFTGRGAGAEWPVGRQGENQLYHFANYNFTLVATVSIHNVPKGNIPLMGVRAGTDGETKLMELSYDSEKKWQLLCGDGNTKELGSIGETDTPQHVVILLKNGTQCTTYVDGQRVGNAQCELGNGESKKISHFYIGGDGDGADDKESREGVSVTVTNVLLYNRPWDDTEIGAFNPNKADILVEMDRPVEGDAIQFYPGGGKEEPRQLLGSSGTGGASTTAVSTITTPSAGGKESVMQVVSEKSSDGHKNVGGGSFSDGDPTVETREEGTDGHEEEVNTQVREVNATALSSSLGNASQGNNSDAGTMRGSGMVPSLLLLLLGLWGLAAL
ncbi:trans-sialidase [Trypanosoma cruzi cruzi]|uniref:Putative trans-sialidase, Group V n=1 Tax=Trypanosoma cruzi TaxID=5693 RepID=A0A2V2VHK2_TRYCR|nr:trans-sialidase [Trypanosoma cruzi cruzi]PWU93813.1 putative trans-sialidase, Group V [Trypanosoma cruzi]